MCENCLQSCISVFQKVSSIENDIDAVKQDVSKSIEEKTQTLQNLQDSLVNFLYPPHRVFNDIQEQLVQISMQNGNVHYVT